MSSSSSGLPRLQNSFLWIFVDSSGCALWAIWGDKNARVHENTIKLPKVVSSWKCPPDQFVKINFDGAYDLKDQCSASGVVVRDNEGEVLASKSKIYTNVASAFAAEALACREAVQVGFDMQQRRVIIEGDSLTVIKRCRYDSTDRSLIGSFIYDIRQKKQFFSEIRFDFIPRVGNILAHMLAKETLKRKEEFYLMGEVPSFAETQQRDESLREPD
ncbi:glycine, alanine and asparagine-rich protein-like [Gossypium australe]|uniref:Glycine, alanine and asparagine-rich protein-like n=1 Tax=Gossypium australe TaxID=47621 RepID=A0A5B6WWT0_9ROSI|nr:glycine, alanine and asparagine-rich protein-like [Gossypium australe]